ncbi:MAG: CBS domain-containing protein [candidate division Zixibacteria bacterium]|nr:CBS domain-containing protein [candidate division Zixibacteria bacterium]
MSSIFKRVTQYINRKLLGAKVDTDEELQNIEEEMMETLERASSSGDIDLAEDEREMIHSIFELGDTIAREIMVPRINIAFIKENHTVDDIREIVNETGYSRFPLIDDDIDDILGIILVKDVFLNYDDLIEGKIALHDLVRKPLIFPESKKVDELLRDMKRLKSHFSVIIDEYGGTAGILTIEDIVEEIVGEIEDEYDEELPPIEKIKDNQYLVNANMSIEELIGKTGINLPCESFETLGGFIYDQVGSLPDEGQTVQVDNLKFIVDKITGQRIISIRLIIEKKEKASGKRHNGREN